MKTLESLMPTLFITLIPSGEGVHLYAELRKNAKVKKRFDEQLVRGNENLEKKIRHLEAQHTVSYIVLLEAEASQGVLKSCSESGGMDPSSIEMICSEKGWGLYMAKDDLHDRQRAYKNIGLDLLFSPFSLLHSIYEEGVSINDGLYLLFCSGYVFGSVYKDGALIFGHRIQTLEPLSLLQEGDLLGRYVDTVQSIIKAFYESKTDTAMFIEKIYIADALDFDTRLENRLEEELFVEVAKRSVDLSHELVLLSEKEL